MLFVVCVLQLPVHLKDSPVCELCKLLQEFLGPYLTTATEVWIEESLALFSHTYCSEVLKWYLLGAMGGIAHSGCMAVPCSSLQQELEGILEALCDELGSEAAEVSV